MNLLTFGHLVTWQYWF